MRRCLILLTFCLAVSLVHSSAQTQEKKNAAPAVRADAFGDPLPAGAIARIGTVRYRLLEGRNGQASALSPDGKLLAVAGFRGQIEFWELPAWTKKPGISIRDINRNNPPQFNTLAFSADSKKLLTFDYNQQHVYLLDVATGKSVKKLVLERKKNLNNPLVTLSRDQKTIVVSFYVEVPNSRVQEVQVWDVDKEKITQTFQLPMNRFDGRAHYVISADGRWLAQCVAQENMPAGGRFGGRLETSIEFWDLKTGKTTRKIDTDTVMQKITFSPDGKWLAASNGQTLLRIYDVADGKEKHNIRLRRGAVNLLEFSPDSASLFVADIAGTITRWDPVSGELKATHPVSPANTIGQLAFGADGKILALAPGMEALAFWEVTTGKVLSPTNVPTSVISELKFSSNGELFVGSNDGGLAWWNPRTAVKLRDLKLESANLMNGNMIYYDDFGGMGGMIGMGGFPGRSYYPRRGAGLATLSPAGNFLVSNQGSGASFYDVKTGKLLYDDDSAASTGQGGISFFDGDNKVASIQQKRIRLWNARTGRDVAHFDVPLREQEVAIKLVAAPRGKHFAVATANNQGQGRVVLWDAELKKIVREWPTQDRQEAMTFSPDHQWLAVAGSPNRLLLSHVGAMKGDHYVQLPRSVGEISQLAFSPDGRQLACAAIRSTGDFEEGRIAIYELASKKIRLDFAGHANAVIDRLAYGHDSTLLASGATDTTVLVWQAGLRACAESPAAGPPTPKDLADRFTQMSDADAKHAFQGMIELVKTPAATIKLLDGKIAPAKKPSSGEKTIPLWIQDLGSGQYAIRVRASNTLKKIGPSTEIDLRAALAKAKDVETKRRIEELLAHFSVHDWTQDEVLHARAVEVLEAIGTSEARTLLTRWTTGDAAAILTQEAAKAVRRMASPHFSRDL